MILSQKLVGSIQSNDHKKSWQHTDKENWMYTKQASIEKYTIQEIVSQWMHAEQAHNRTFSFPAKSANLANLDGFSQKCCLKRVKILFDAFISINEWKYV